MDGTKRGIQEVLGELKRKEQQVRENPRSAQAGTETISNPDCEICNDNTGWIENREGIGEVWVQCSCREWRRMQRVLKASEITDNFRKIGFGEFETEGKHQSVQAMYNAALAYFQNFNEIRSKRQNSVLYMGQPGGGKTHLLTALCNNIMQKKTIPDDNGQERPVNVQYFPYVEGFNDLKDDFDLLETKLDRMKKADILFIDDMFKPSNGVPRATNFQIEQMYAVINYRYMEHLPIFISTELIAEDLIDIDDALASRIIEMAKGHIVTVQGDPKQINHRLQGIFS